MVNNLRKIIKKIGILFLVCVVVLVSGCGTVNKKGSSDKNVANSDKSYTFTDALGQKITVDNPKRVVALMQSFAEVWLLAGGEDTLVGVTEDAKSDKELGLSDSVTVVGTFEQPNLEVLMSLEPDLVLLSAEQTRTDSHVKLKDTLAKANIQAAYFSVTHFPDYLKMLKICTDITGDSDAYQKNGLEVEKNIEKVVEKNKRDEEPSVLFCITYSGGVRPQSADTMTGKMLDDLGCYNILNDYPSLLKDFSMEKILEIDPDYIFVVSMGNSSKAANKALKNSLESDPAWKSLSAVKNEHYHILPQDKFLYKPNEEWADSYEYLAELLNE